MWNTGEQKDVRVATVGVSIAIKGEISASEDLTIDGQVEGRIDLPEHTLTIGPNATVVADIAAKVVIVFGSVMGSVIAREKADIRTGASVEGSVSCGRLSVQEGATLNGAIASGQQRAKAARTKSEQAA